MPSVLIVGAGPTGLTLAAVLARHGVTARVIDRATTPPPDRSRATLVQVRTLELFDQLGIADEVLRAGINTERARFFLPDGGSGEVEVRRDWIESRFGGLELLPQDETERILGEAVARAGVRVERGVELATLAQDATGADVTLRHADGRDEAGRYAWVVGCDGAHSVVRHLSGLPFPGETYPDECMLGDVDLDWGLPDGDVAICPSAEGFLLAFPLPGVHHFRVIMVKPASGTMDDRHLGEDEFLAQLTRMAPRFPDRGGAPPILLRSRWLTRYRLHRRGVPAYRAGRCFVAGDAAHIHSPVGGQGMNTGIQDAFNLGWKLAMVMRGEAPPWLLDSYHDERHRVGDHLLRVTDRAFGLLAGGGRLGRAIRTVAPALGIRVVGAPCIRRRVARFVSQTGIRYAGSALSTEGSGCEALGPQAPRAGDRMPDVPLDDARRLSTVLTRPGYLLLMFAGGDAARASDLAGHGEMLRAPFGAVVHPVVVVHAAADADGMLADPRGRAHARFGGANAAYLVRPDGYIAWRGFADRPDELRLALRDRLLATGERSS